MSRMLHRIAHRLRWYSGRVETWYDARSRMMVGFRCDTCGALDGVHPVPRHIAEPAR